MIKKFYIQSPDPFDTEGIDAFFKWFQENGQRGKDWALSPDQNKMGGTVAVTFPNEEMASHFVIKYSNWIIPEPPDIDPEINSYSINNWNGRGYPLGHGIEDK